VGKKVVVEKLDTLSTFIWCAAFAASSATFTTLLEIYSEKNDTKRWTRREIVRQSLHVLSIGFWGGLSGWAVGHVLPGASSEVLGIVAAVLGSGGHNAMRLFMTGVVERVLGVKVVTDDRA
jgi:hypothetical protein